MLILLFTLGNRRPKSRSEIIPFFFSHLYDTISKNEISVFLISLFVLSYKIPKVLLKRVWEWTAGDRGHCAHSFVPQ